MFSVLDDKEKDIVIGAMEECHFKYINFIFKKTRRLGYKVI